MPDEQGRPFVVLGVTGGIAAYKAVELCRLLVDGGCHVAPVLTNDACRFIQPLTFTALATEPAQTELYGAPSPIPHTRLGQAADLIVVAPATANLIGRYANGLADDLLTNTLIATRAPVLLAAAMHTEMWEQASVQENLATLRRRGTHVLDPEEGRLAGGDSGRGRMVEPAGIAQVALEILGSTRTADLAGLRVVISAGGTREAIDPVRFLTNRSSGKQGHALAEAAVARGAAVTLVTAAAAPVRSAGPGSLEVISVESAKQMHTAMLAAASGADIVVMAAAVADFRPKDPAASKVKRDKGTPKLKLEPTEDILRDLVAARKKPQVVVGFAAETDDVLEHGRSKITHKGCDLLVVNDVSASNAGFDHETNEVVILGSDGSELHVPLASKRMVADAIFDRITSIRSAG